MTSKQDFTSKTWITVPKRKWSLWLFSSLALLGPISAAAEPGLSEICFHEREDCFTVEDVDCDTYVSGTGNPSTCTPIVALTVNDHLLSGSGRAWLVAGDKKTPIASDRFSSYLSELNIKYAAERRKDPVVKRQIQSEYDTFLRKADDRKVSSSRLQKLSKKMKLPIVEMKQKR